MFAKLLYFVLGVSVSTATAYALTFSNEMEIVESQSSAVRFTGEYFSDVSNPQLQVHTYEKLCKGFVIIEETPTEIIYTGYGDLSNEYTYTVQKPILATPRIASSTEPIKDILGDDIGLQP